MNTDIPEEWLEELAWWANSTPRPMPPQLIPGLPWVNSCLMLEYRERLEAWKMGKAEALLRGLKQSKLG